MFMISLLIIAFIIALLHALHWRLASRIFMAVFCILFIFVAFGPIPVWLLNKLQSSYVEKPIVNWKENNAIILLGGGTVKLQHINQVEPTVFAYSRIVESVKQYNECKKTNANCKLIISGGDAFKNGVSEAISYQGVLVDLGVNTEDIIAETQSKSTWQNADFTSRILADNKIQYAMLITSGFHMERSTLYFDHFGASVVPMQSDYLTGKLSVLPLSYNLTVADYALQEYIGILRYYIYNALGWNARRRLQAPA